MLKYSAVKGFEKVPPIQVNFMNKLFDEKKHENLAQAIGFDILQDERVFDEAVKHDNQSYSVVVKTQSVERHELGHAYTNYHALIEVHCYDKETIIFVETPLDCFDLFSKLIQKHEIIKAGA